MSRLIDISLWVGPGAKIHSPELYPALKLEKILSPEMPAAAGRTAHSIHSPVHVGTHIDAPLHMFADGREINDYPLERFMGTAHLVNMCHKVPGGSILPEDLSEQLLDLEPHQIVVIRTDMSEKFGYEDFYDTNITPYFTPEVAQWLVEKRVKMVGLDFHKGRVDSQKFTTTRILHRGDTLTLSYLANLKEIRSKKFTLIAFPLKIKGLEASPVRAIAIED